MEWNTMGFLRVKIQQYTFLVVICRETSSSAKAIRNCLVSSKLEEQLENSCANRKLTVIPLDWIPPQWSVEERFNLESDVWSLVEARLYSSLGPSFEKENIRSARVSQSFVTTTGTNW